MTKKVRGSHHSDAAGVELTPRQNAHKQHAQVARSARRGIKPWKIAAALADRILALFGLGGRSENLIASDLVARWFFSRVFTTQLLKTAKENPIRKFYFATFIDDSGMTSDRSPFVRLQQLTDKVRRAIDKYNVQAVCVIEVHPIMNFPGGGHGRSLLFHVHVAMWSEAADFDYRRMENELNASRAFNCSLGADAVKIEPINPTPADYARVGHYMTKPCYSAKNRMPNHNKAGEFLLMDTTAGYRDELAIRVMEGLSQIPLMSLVFGVGSEGAKFRQAVRKRVETWHAKRPVKGTIVPASEDIWRLWLDVRKEHGSVNYLPYRFDVAMAPTLPAAFLPPVPSKVRDAQTRPMGATKAKKAARTARRLRRSKRSRNKPHSLTGRRVPIVRDEIGARLRRLWEDSLNDDL